MLMMGENRFRGLFLQGSFRDLPPPLKTHTTVLRLPLLCSLESWGTEEQSRPYFRKRLWGSWVMLRALITGLAPQTSAVKRHAVTNLLRSYQLEGSYSGRTSGSCGWDADGMYP